MKQDFLRNHLLFCITEFYVGLTTRKPNDARSPRTELTNFRFFCVSKIAHANSENNKFPVIRISVQGHPTTMKIVPPTRHERAIPCNDYTIARKGKVCK